MLTRFIRYLFYIFSISSISMGDPSDSGDLLDALSEYERTNYPSLYGNHSDRNLRYHGSLNHLTKLERARRLALTSEDLADLAQFDTVYFFSSSPVDVFGGVDETIVFGDSMIYYNNYSYDSPNHIRRYGKEPISEDLRIVLTPLLSQLYAPTPESDFSYHHYMAADGSTEERCLTTVIRNGKGFIFNSDIIVLELLFGDPSYYTQLHNRALRNADYGIYGCKDTLKTHRVLW